MGFTLKEGHLLLHEKLLDHFAPPQKEDKRPVEVDEGGSEQTAGYTKLLDKRKTRGELPEEEEEGQFCWKKGVRNGKSRLKMSLDRN